MLRRAIIGVSLLMAMALPAAAAQGLGDNGLQSQPALKTPAALERGDSSEEKPIPYARNYAEDAVRSLGFRDGKMSIFEIKPQDDRESLMPTVSGTVGGDGAMLKLRWKP